MPQLNPTITAAPSWQELFELFQKQDDFIRYIVEFREKHGPEWLKQFKREYPDVTWIVDLVANHDADSAVAELLKEYGDIPLVKLSRGFLEPQVRALHARLKHEIEVKR